MKDGAATFMARIAAAICAARVKPISVHRRGASAGCSPNHCGLRPAVQLISR